MADVTRWGSAPLVEVDGVALPPDVLPLLEEVVVDDSLHLPDVVELRLRDDGRDVAQRCGLRLGATVRVSARSLGTAESAPLLTAQVATLEADIGPRGHWLLVRGYDASWRLAQSRRTTSYTDVTDSDAVRRIAGLAGVGIGQVDATPVVHPHLAQIDLTDWDFLQLRARACGMECVVVRGELHFRRPRPAGEAPEAAVPGQEPRRHQLVVGANLLQFRPRVTAHGQVREVEVRGWDAAAKRAVVGRAATTSGGAQALDDPARLAGVSGGAVHVAVRSGPATQAEADLAAVALAEVVGSTSLEARGTALGDPSLTAGSAVSVAGAGRPFDGRYVLTTTRHLYDRRGYRTSFEVSGRAERSLAGLLGAPPPTAPGSGVGVGEVTDVSDPLSQGRVRVRLPWLSDTYESWWARVAQLGAGDGRGSAFLPEVGDEVLVAFEQGDLRRPVVVGGLHNGVDALPLADGLVDATSGAVQRRGFVSREGHRLVLDDGRDASGVVVETGDGGVRVALSARDTVVAISSRGEVSISAGTGVTVTSDAGLTLHARGRLELKGDAGVSVSGGPEVAVSAAQVRLG